MDAPHRHLELTLKLGADNWDELFRALNQIQYELAIKANEDAPSVQITSGGSDAGYHLEVKVDPEVTHASYFNEVDAWIAWNKERRANGEIL